MKLMEGKKGLIIGLLNERSIAWGIAEQIHKHGGEVICSYPNDSIKPRVEALAEKLDSKGVYKCDVQNQEDIKELFENIRNNHGHIDYVVHAVAFSDKNELKGRFLDTSLNNFLTSMHISCYSLIDISREAEKILNPGGSILTLSYYGANKYIPNYNVMGPAKAALESSVQYLAAELGRKNIRVNSISAGPIRTMAASGIGDFSYILKWQSQNAPLKRNVTIEDVGKGALYLLSDMASGVTGQNQFVDCGYSTIGMKLVDAEDLVKK